MNALQHEPYRHPTFPDPQSQHYYGQPYPQQHQPNHFPGWQHHYWGQLPARNEEIASLHEMQPPRQDFSTPSKENTSVAVSAPEERTDPEDNVVQTAESDSTLSTSISSAQSEAPLASSTPLPDASTSTDIIEDSDNSLKNGKAKELWKVLNATTIGRSILRGRRNCVTEIQMETICNFIAPNLFNTDKPFRQTYGFKALFINSILTHFNNTNV